jgi:signal transduction histidine kinase
MGHRKRHSAAPSSAPRRSVSGARRIDERVRLGQALAAALEPFGVGAAVVDPTTLRFTFVSEALASLLGATVEELVALHSVADRVALADARAAEAALSHARPSEVTLRFLHASGDEIELDLSVRPFDPDRHRADGSRSLAVIFRGVGERKERESLRAAVGEAAEALRARDELFSIATHDVRSPLMALRLHAQVLTRCLKRESPDIPRARRALSEVEKHTERTMYLADRLLDAARIRSGHLEIERIPMDLAEVVRDVATRFGAEAATAGATVIIDGERSVLGRWDPLRMEQIVANLVSNALRFGGGNPIAIELRTLGRRALLTVRDHGPGIPDEDQARIFEPFERAKGARGTPGSGLGLWIVRRLVDAHGGTVRLASAVGKGTVFAVDLPKDPNDDPPGPRDDDVAPDRI